jgi:hypothetical protein
MAQERLPNHDNFQQLWNFFASKGVGDVQNAGLLANVYAESRGNPMSLNPNDGSDGSDSIGIFQANADRAVGLRNFAAERGVTANDLLAQAGFHYNEGTTGSEQRGWNQGMAGQTPAESALGFASGFIRPAAQHIPQRAAYGDMMYDIFANGNPDGYGAGLAYDADQAERMSREPASRLSFGEDMPAMDERTGARVGASRNEIAANFSRMFIEQAGQGPEAMTTGPVPPITGRRQPTLDTINSGPPDLQGLQSAAEDRMVTSTAPQLGEVSGSGELPDYDAMINEQFPAAEGEPSTSEELSSLMWPVAEASAYKLGVPVEDAPTTPSGIAAAANAPEPDPEDNSEDAERRRNRRLLAADMLQTLSVGLGQMSTGQAVNLGDVLNSQQNRGMARDEMDREAAAAQQAQQQQQQQAFTVAQELSAMGMDGMARIAMSGPDGLGQALDTLGQIQGRAPATSTGFEGLSVGDRRAALRYAGLDEQDVTFFSQNGMEDLAIDAIRTNTLPDPTADAAAADQAGVEREILGLAGIGSDYANDPAVRTAFTSASRNPTQANATALREALAAAGASEAELAASASEAPVPLNEVQATFYSKIATPDQIAAAMEDATLAEQIRNAGGEALEKGAIAQAQQDVMQNVPPERIRFLEELAGNETAMRTELRLRSADAGTDGFNDVQTIQATNLLDAQQTKLNNLTTREPMVSAMRELVTLLADPNVDRSEGGPLTTALTGMQNIGAQLGLDIGAQEPMENYMARIMEAYTGEFFQNFRLEGSGATSDMEAKNYMNAMPNIRDENLKRLGLAQRIIRMNERDTLALQLDQEWVNMHSDDPNMLLDPRARAEFVRDGVASEAKELYPVVDLTAESWVDSVADSFDSGNIARDTVIRYTPADGSEPRFVMFGDLANELGLEL